MSSNSVHRDPLDIAWCAGLFVGAGHRTIKVIDGGDMLRCNS